MDVMKPWQDLLLPMQRKEILHVHTVCSELTFKPFTKHVLSFLMLLVVLFVQSVLQMAAKKDKFIDFSIFTQASMAEAQIQALNLPPSTFFSPHHICLLVTCLTIFWPNNFYTSSLSEYFANKVEEKKEIEKQEEGQEGEEKKEEDEAAKVAPAPATQPPAAKSKPKKGGKGFTLFNFNIFCNIDIDKGPKRHPVSCSKGLVTLSLPFWSQQFLQQNEGGENTVSSSFTCIGWTEFLPLFYSWFRQEVIILQWGIRMEEGANEE